MKSCAAISTVYAMLLGLLSATHAADAPCRSLTPAQRAIADSALRSVRIGPPCFSTVAACLDSAEHACPIAPRLQAFACWMASVDKSLDDIVFELHARYALVTDSVVHPIAPSPFPVAGDADAPVMLTAYIGAHCPMCKEVVGELYHSVTRGALRGKARLRAKPFTVRMGDKALAAADSLGAFWNYFLALGKLHRRVEERDLHGIAQELDLDLAAFKRLMNDQSLHAMLEESRREGRANGVTVTPTFFYNGHRYRGYKMPMWIEDAVEIVRECDHR
jgi:protein-disulfide isomerase